jgi:hypothetical protein
MPYNKLEMEHTPFVRRLEEKAKMEYFKKIEEILQNLVSTKKEEDNLSAPFTINEPPTDENGNYVLFQNVNGFDFETNINFDGGSCNFNVAVPHKRKLYDPTSVNDKIVTKFQEIGNINTKATTNDINGGIDANQNAIDNNTSSTNTTRGNTGSTSSTSSGGGSGGSGGAQTAVLDKVI